MDRRLAELRAHQTNKLAFERASLVGLYGVRGGRRRSSKRIASVVRVGHLDATLPRTTDDDDDEPESLWTSDTRRGSAVHELRAALQLEGQRREACERRLRELGEIPPYAAPTPRANERKRRDKRKSTKPTRTAGSAAESKTNGGTSSSFCIVS